MPKDLRIKDLVDKLLMDASGGDFARRIIFKLAGTSEGYGEKEVKRVYSKEPNSIIIELV